MPPQPEILERPDACRLSWRACLLLLAGLALLFGAGALRGGFLPGDDITLVRDNLLVNRPSPRHAGTLVTTSHRDLYQPLPLLSFAVEFAVAQAAGWHLDTIAILLHADNALLHTFNVLLVATLLRRWTQRRDLAFLAAALFAVHPLHAEPVAWINGRMTLLATLFTLLATLLADRHLRQPRHWLLAAWLAAALLAMVSKVQVALPVLVVCAPLARRVRPTASWWSAWVVTVLLTATFVGINLQIGATALGSAPGGTSERLLRTLVAIAWYLSRAVVPVGLAPYHPVGAITASAALSACAVIALAGMVAWWLSRRRRMTWIAVVWFGAAIAAALPLTGLRDLQVAERYAYVPNMGLLLIVALLLDACLARLVQPGRAVVIGVACAALLLAGWRTMVAYRDDVARTARVLAVYPDNPRMLARHAWAQRQAGRPADAREVAERLLALPGAPCQSDGWQILGMLQLDSGAVGEAEDSFRKAITANEEDALAWYRLGMALEAAGALVDARTAYDESITLQSHANPARLRYVGVLFRLGETAEAERGLRAMIDASPHDPQPRVMLADRLQRTGRIGAARAIVEGGLALVPEHVDLQVVLCAIALREHSHAEAEGLALRLARAGALTAAGRFDAFAGQVQAVAESEAQDGWAYYIMAVVGAETGRVSVAHGALSLVAQLGGDAALLARARALAARLPPPADR